MKRYLSLFLLLAMVLALLSGCGKDPKPTVPDPSSTPDFSDPATTKETASSTIPGDTVSVQWPVNEAGSSLIEYDPGREIFFLLGNADYTIYRSLSATSSYMFHILSLKPLDTSAIQASIPISAPYTVRISETKLYRKDDFNQTVIEWYGFDKSLYDTYKKLDASLPAYESLKGEDLPRFYVYKVHFYVDSADMIEESFSTVKVQIGEDVYEHDIGNVRFEILGTLDELAAVYDKKLYHGSSGYTTDMQPYNGGLYRKGPFFKFTADQDMTLTSLRLMNPHIELVDVIMTVTDTTGMTMEYTWDQSQPVYLFQGDQVVISAILHDPNMEQLGYQTKVWGALDYEFDGGKLTKLSECHLYYGNSINLYTLCAMVFHGIDMEPYYTHIHATDAWRENYKEYLK